MKEEPSRAKKNWSKLRTIILSKNLAHKQNDKKFNLFQKNCKHIQKEVITQYCLEQFKLLQKSPLPIYNQLLHFQSQIDATGKWVWEAQEIAAYFFLNEGKRIVKEVLDKKEEGSSNHFSIHQLGAGSSGLAGIALAKLILKEFSDYSLNIELSDGQADNILYLNENLQLNMKSEATTKAYQMLWGDEKSLSNLSQTAQQKKQFDVLILCDCLYFSQFHEQLLMSINSFLSDRGITWIINPSRGQSMSIFLMKALKSGFQYQFIQFNNQPYQNRLSFLRTNKNFNQDKHSQFFIKLQRT